mmetsp:Transcript_25272/g.39987  ORF Transcript_25272/g.39987 Transcript_25272/m.39987 type:complete len:93 (-) Transcript_25272:939-1217(-)
MYAQKERLHKPSKLLTDAHTKTLEGNRCQCHTHTGIGKNNRHRRRPKYMDFAGNENDDGLANKGDTIPMPQPDPMHKDVVRFLGKKMALPAK